MADDLKKIAEDLKGKKAKVKTVEGKPEGTKATKLPKDVSNALEEVFGAKLSKVRVHVGPSATDMCKKMKAKAFTMGNDIYLSKPASAKDSQLLTHELTHVIQQAGGKKMPKEQEGKAMVTK